VSLHLQCCVIYSSGKTCGWSLTKPNKNQPISASKQEQLSEGLDFQDSRSPHFSFNRSDSIVHVFLLLHQRVIILCNEKMIKKISIPKFIKSFRLAFVIRENRELSVLRQGWFHRKEVDHLFENVECGESEFDARSRHLLSIPYPHCRVDSWELFRAQN